MQEEEQGKDQGCVLTGCAAAYSSWDGPLQSEVTVAGYTLGVYALPMLIRVRGHNREGGVAWAVEV